MMMVSNCRTKEKRKHAAVLATWSCLVLLLSCHTASGATCVSDPPLPVVYVTNVAVEANDCCGAEASPCGSVGAAVARVAEKGTIQLLGGRHVVDQGGIDLSGRSLTIQGHDGSVKSTINCGRGPCLKAVCSSAGGTVCDSVVLSMSNFTLKEGSSESMGGCLYVENSALYMEDMSLQGCHATGGGGAVAVVGSNATILDTTIAISQTLGPAGGGGAIYLGKGADAAIQGLVVVGCSAPASQGGAIFAEDSVLDVSESKFTSCTARAAGGAISTLSSQVKLQTVRMEICQAEVGGGYSDVGSSVQMLNSQAVKCSAAALPEFAADFTYGGGAHFNGSKAVFVSRSDFLNCSSLADAGGLKLVGCANATLVQVSASYNNAFLNGGGINFQSSSVNMAGGEVTGNTVGYPQSFGAGFLIYDSAVSLEGVVVSHNVAQLGPYEQTQGGGLYCTMQDPTSVSSLAIIGSTFDSNQAVTGGGLFLGGIPTTITDTTFSDNVASSYGGAVTTMSETHIKNGSMTSNTAATAGAVYLITQPQQMFEVDGTAFTSNVALTGDGGAISIPAGNVSVTITNASFRNNSAAEGNGGAVSSAGFDSQFVDSLFENNTAALSGGAISVVGVQSVGKATAGVIRGCTFRGNQAPLGGGALNVASEAAASVSGSVFSENNSTKGGAILVDGFATAQLDNSTCSWNTASMGGGCLSLQSFASANISDTGFFENYGLSEGGALRLTGSTSLLLTRCNITANTASSGGALWAELNSKFTAAENTLFADNEALYQGGAVYQTHQAQSVWLVATLRHNRAPVGGAMLANGGAVVQVTGSVLLNNTGTAVVLQGNAKCDLKACAVVNNTASSAGTGGGVLLTDTALLSMEGTVLRSNRATLGGAVRMEGQSNATITACQFAINSATQGGALSAAGSAYFRITAGSMIDNSASASGGGIATVDNTSGIISQTKFVSNQAGGNGAGVYIERNPVSRGRSELVALRCQQLTFNNNVAHVSQGAAFYEATYNPAFRTTCEECNFGTVNDTLGSVASSIRLLWPGANDTGLGVFRVWASSQEPITGLQVEVLDSYGERASQDNTSVATVESSSNRVGGILSGTANAGLASIPSISVNVPADESADLTLLVKVVSPTQSFPPISRVFQVSFCPAGTSYSTSNHSCSACPRGHWCAAGQAMEYCPPGTFTFKLGSQSAADCVECDESEGLSCVSGRAQVKAGYWLDSSSLSLNNSKPAVYTCDLTRGCSGFQVDEDFQQCKPGYEGRVCAKCTDGYYAFLSMCNRCTGLYRGMPFVFLCVLVGIVWLILNWVSTKFNGADTVLVEIQLLAVIAMYNLNNFPGSWVDSIMQAFNLALFYPDFLGPECEMGSYTYGARWAFTALLPLVGAGLYFLSFFLHDTLNRLAGRHGALAFLRSQRTKGERMVTLIKRVVNLFDILYVPVVVRVFQALHHQQYDQKVLSADPAVVWLSPTHVRLLVPAILYLVAYVGGLPLLFSWLLVKGKVQGLLHDEAFLDRYSRLYERYEAPYWWWYVPMVWGRRVIYAAIAVFWSANPDLQAFITFLLLLVTGVVHYFSRPYKAASLDYLFGVLLLGQYLYLLGAVANTYFTSYVAGSPAEALVGTAEILYICAICLVLFYEIHVMWSQYVVRQWARANAAMGLPVDDGPSSGGSGSGSGGASMAGLVPLEQVSAWFNPRVVAAFFQDASVEDLQLMQTIRRSFSAEVPTHEEFQLTCEVLDRIPKTMRYAVINQLIFNDDGCGPDSPNLLPSYNPKSPAGFAGAAADLKSPTALISTSRRGQLSIRSDNFEKTEGLRRLGELRTMAEVGVSEGKKAGDSVRVMLNPQSMEIVATWLLFGGVEGRRALKELVTKFRVWLYITPTEKSLVSSMMGGSSVVEEHPLELTIRRKMRLWLLQLFI